MSLKSSLIKAAGLSALITALSAGAAFAAIATGSVNVRSGPGTGYHVVDRLFPGEIVAITDRSAGWCAVSKPGPNGWVSCAYLSQTALDNGPRFRGDRFGRGPGVSFSFGFGTPAMHVHPHGPWW